MVPCKTTAEEVSFEWSHHRISSTDSKVKSIHVFSLILRVSRLRATVEVMLGYKKCMLRLRILGDAFHNN